MSNRTWIRVRTSHRPFRVPTYLALAMMILGIGTTECLGQQGDSCESPCTRGTPWTEESIFTRLPQFPDCEVEIRQRSRECNEGTEVDFQWIQWRVPNDPNDTNDPCHDLHDAYLSSSPNQDLFLRDLYNHALQANVNYVFNRRYTQDSLLVVAYPNNPTYQANLASRQCPEGQTTFRVIHAKCMIAIVRSYTEERTRRKDRLTPNGLMSVTDGPVDFNKVRYAPCDAQTSYCCTRQYKICRDTGTNANHYQIVYTPSSQNECPSTFDTTLAHPPIAQDESVVGVCNEYCQQGEEPPKSRDDEHGSMNLGVLPVDKAGTP